MLQKLFLPVTPGILQMKAGKSGEIVGKEKLFIYD